MSTVACSVGGSRTGGMSDRIRRRVWVLEMCREPGVEGGAVAGSEPLDRQVEQLGVVRRRTPLRHASNDTSPTCVSHRLDLVGVAELRRRMPGTTRATIRAPFGGRVARPCGHQGHHREQEALDDRDQSVSTAWPWDGCSACAACWRARRVRVLADFTSRPRKPKVPRASRWTFPPSHAVITRKR